MGRYGAGEDVCGLGELVADDVGVHAQRDRRVRVAEPGRDHVHGDASQQQGRRVYMAKVMQPGVRQRLVLPIVAGVDELGHKRRRRVGVDGLAPGGGGYVVIGAAPLGADSQPLLGLALAVISEHLYGVGVDADGARPAALGRLFDALTRDDGGRAGDAELGQVQVDVPPAKVEQLAASSAGVCGEPVEGKQPVSPGGVQH